MSSNHNSRKQNSGLYWLAVLVAFMISPPLGILMAAIKLIRMQNDKKREQDRERREQTRQQYSQTWQANTQNRTRTGRDDFQAQETWNPSRASRTADRNASAKRAETDRQNSSIIRKLTSPQSGRVMMIGGGILAAFFGFATLLTFFSEFWMLSYGKVADFLAELITPVFFTGVGVILFVFGRGRMKQAQRYREYINIIGGQDAVSIRTIARITNRDPEDVSEDLNNLIYQGALGEEAYVDQSTQQLILTRAGREAARAAAERALQEDEIRRQEDERRRDAQDTAEASVLAEIRQVNEEIDDVRISEQIDRIEEITRLILQYQTDHPESRTQLHKFLSYYLPTTLKLLQSYAEFEGSSVQGTNITETRNRIEALMDKVVDAFERQYDQLFADTRMDIESEITVLENMMKQDGLTEDEESNPFSQFRAQGQS